MKSHKSHIRCIIAVVGVLTLASCRAKNGSEGAMPLSIGNSWTYEIDNHVPLLDSLTSDHRDTWAITSDSIISGERWDRMQTRGMFANRSDGVYLWLQGKRAPGLFLAYPAKIGDWFRNSYGDSTVFVRDRIHVKVEAGEFSCCLYKSYQSPYVYCPGPRRIADSLFAYIYFAPGVGMVRLDRVGKNEDIEVLLSQQRLVEFIKH